MKYGYARVSTTNQDLKDQIETINNKGHVNTENIFSEKMTGKTTDRPELNRLTELVEAGDEIVFAKLDRLARNVQEGLALINELNAKGVTVNVLNAGVFTGDENPMQDLMKNMLLAFAEFERAQIVERTQSGKAYSKAHNPNFKDGRRPKGTEAQRKLAYAMIQSGKSYTQVANETAFSRSTVQRIVKEFKTKELA